MRSWLREKDIEELVIQIAADSIDKLLAFACVAQLTKIALPLGQRGHGADEAVSLPVPEPFIESVKESLVVTYRPADASTKLVLL